MSNYKKQSKVDSGDNSNLPDSIRLVAKPRSDVVAWTRFDPALNAEMQNYVCNRTFGEFLYCPIYWPCTIILLPCFCSTMAAMENSIRSQYWVLTQDELKVVSLDHDASCIEGCSRTGDKVQSIPLENITDCGKDNRGNGCCNNLTGDLPTIYIDTASSGASSGNSQNHEAVGVALKDYEWMVTSILSQRDTVKRGHIAPVAPVGQAISARGDAKTAKERLAELQNLLDGGLISDQEYAQKREEILKSI